MNNDNSNEKSTIELLKIIGEENFDRHTTHKEILAVLKPMRLMLGTFIVAFYITPWIFAKMGLPWP